MNNIEDNSKKKYFLGLIIGVGISFLCICLAAVFVLILKLDRAYCEVFATISVSVGAYFSSFYVSKNTGKKGYLIGLVIGGAFFVIITVISLIVSKGKISSNTAFHFLIILLSSVVGGITGVNKKPKTIV